MEQYNAGKIQKAERGTLSEYEYFLPVPLSEINWCIENKKILLYLEEANRLLGELNAYSTLIPNVDYFVQMHVVSEAVSSSKIEGTKTEIDEALLSENEINPERRDDWQEVMNYIKAMNHAIANLTTLPVSVRLIKATHAQLMSGVRGEHKMPGEIRSSQNWIGGASINTAHFVPPHHAHIPDLLSDWEKFWHNSSIQLPVLIKLAICHYQFETIHPFLDGNGRVGRLLITLQLIEQKFLKHPVLYISDFFEAHRQSYYDSLDRVRSHDDIDQWILFFLEGIMVTAKKSIKTFEHIITLRASFEKKIMNLGRRAPQGQLLLLHLFTDPVVSVSDIEKALGVTYVTANKLVKDFVNLGILEEKTGFSRNRIFIMRDYIQLFRK